MMTLPKKIWVTLSIILGFIGGLVWLKKKA